MSIIRFDGFDFYSIALSDTQRGVLCDNSFWKLHNNGSDNNALIPRNNGNSMGFVNNVQGYMYLETKDLRTITNDSTHVIGGFAFMLPSTPVWNYDNTLFQLWTIAGTHLYVYVRWGTNGLTYNLSAESANPHIEPLVSLTGFEGDVWNYFEYDIKTTTGQEHCKLWLNGSLIYSNTDTWPGAGAIAEVFLFGVGNPGLPYWYYDDFYLLNAEDDSDGPTFQDRLGPISIVPGTLNADGTLDDMVALGGGDKFEEINEAPGGSDLDASYVYGTNANDQQTFTITGVDQTNTILSIYQMASVKKPTPDITAANFGFVQKKDANVNQDSNSIVLQDSYRMANNYVTTLPDDSPLTAANVEATEWGIELT